jgi:hypothetical protein
MFSFIVLPNLGFVARQSIAIFAPRGSERKPNASFRTIRFDVRAKRGYIFVSAMETFPSPQVSATSNKTGHRAGQALAARQGRCSIRRSETEESK